MTAVAAAGSVGYSGATATDLHRLPFPERRYKPQFLLCPAFKCKRLDLDAQPPNNLPVIKNLSVQQDGRMRSNSPWL